MSYNTIWTSTTDQALVGRVTACIGQETDAAAGITPHQWLASVLWQVVTAADVEAAYAFALTSGTPNPGGDESVISDGMILSSVQAAIAVLPAPAGGPVPP